MSQDVSSVNTEVFREWVPVFLPRIISRLNAFRKVVLILDKYRAHMSVKALELVQKPGVDVVALSAPTNELLQPWDVSVVGTVKGRSNVLIDRYVETAVTNGIHNYMLDGFGVLEYIKSNS